MFGQFYEKFDRMLSEKDELMTNGGYAREMLAELINRARVMEAALTVVREFDYVRARKGDPE